MDEIDDLDAYDLDNDDTSYIKKSNFDNRYHDEEDINDTKNSVLLSNMEKYKNEAIEAKYAINKMKNQANQIVKENKKLKEERQYLHKQMNAQTTALEQSKKRLTNVTRLTEDTKQKLRAESGHQYELEKENQRLVHTCAYVDTHLVFRAKTRSIFTLYLDLEKQLKS